MARYLFILALCFFALSVSGCVPTNGLKAVEIVKHPDAPMLILEISGDRARVAVYVASEKRMVEYGWVELSAVAGWTIHKYDWDGFIKTQ